jgi:membrane-bound serine protease (ClpP class)
VLLLLGPSMAAAPAPALSEKSVVIVPIRQNIEPSLVYLIRRAVKQAIEEKVDLLILDMKTNGGRLDTTEEIISILAEFKGETVTYVNDRAFSAGAFVAVGTRKIYMAPQSVIGAAAPIMVGPTGGAEAIPETIEVKTKSAVRGVIRGVAAKNGHNPDVLEAMIDRNKELTIDGHVINKKGDILTLTDVEANKAYGNPPKPLLSAGTVESLEALLAQLGYGSARRIAIEPTGAERLGTWINAISPLLLIIGAVGLYIEFKTPGFGAPGIIGITAFALYFIGGYIAGFSGFEWMLVFVLGVILLALEFFVFPGTIALGVAGAGLMVLAVFMALIDFYPGVPSTPGGFSWPTIAGPTAESVERALRTLLIAVAGVALGFWLASKWLPKTSIYSTIVSHGVSGAATTAGYVSQENMLVGRTGVTRSPLRPGGKAQFGDAILDVTSQGDMIDNGVPVRIVGYNTGTPVVAAV